MIGHLIGRLTDEEEGKSKGQDTDGDGTPDYLDLDSDDDCIPDEVEGLEDWDNDGVKNFQDPINDGLPSPITLTAITTPFTAPIGIDYHEPTDSLVLSANYPSGSPFNFERILQNGTHQPFSTYGGLTEEVKIATVRSGNAAGFVQEVAAGDHRLVADEPAPAGGTDTGPNPYDLLLAALGSCTSMTIAMYARRKGWPLQAVRVRLRHAKIHAADCADCETKEGRLDHLERVIQLDGDLDDEQRARLIEIANKCPVHKTLTSQIKIETSGLAAAVGHLVTERGSVFGAVGVVAAVVSTFDSMGSALSAIFTRDVYARLIAAQGRGGLHRHYVVAGGNHVDGLYGAFPGVARPLQPKGGSMPVRVRLVVPTTVRPELRSATQPATSSVIR